MNFETEVFKLPCGYRDVSDDTFYTHIEVREMTGNEEDLLTNRKKLQSGVAFDEIIAGCCTLIQALEDEPTGQRKQMTLSDAVNMRMGDRYACFIWIRRISYGDSYKFQVKCPDCAKTSGFDVNLSQLETTYMPEPGVDNYEIVLPRSKDSITFKITTGQEEKKMSKMSDQNPGDAATINLAVRLLKVNDETVRPMPYLKGLPVKDRNFYRNKALKAEGYIENEVELDCSSCFATFKTELPIQKDFFLPTTE